MSEAGRFEVRHHDGPARLGRLSLPGWEDPIETPMLLPVINPNHGTLPAAAIEAEFDPQAFITNAYVLSQSDELRERALAEGVHGLLDVDVPVMTDSGSFQLAEYGDIEVSNEDIVTFQREIDSDIVTPIDIPTHPDASREQAAGDLEVTHERIEAARRLVGDDRLLTGPVQGGTSPQLRRQAGRAVHGSGVDIAPIGAVVPLLEAYRFTDIVDLVVAAKEGLGSGLPVHLFGAGHPMMFSLAVALGCDIFDSAAYALYAREGRYLTPSGTAALDDLATFPCACPVCSAHDPDALRAESAPARERLLARHNLYVSFAELRRIKQAIRDGALFEHLESRVRGHPTLVGAYRRLLDYDGYLERHDPAVKDTFMHVSTESARRPEVDRHHRRLRAMEPTGRLRLVTPAGSEGETGTDWPLRAPFGPIPPELEETYPLTAETPDRRSVQAYQQAAAGVRALAVGASVSITVSAPEWPSQAYAMLPQQIEIDS